LQNHQKVVILVSRLVKLKGIAEYLQAARRARQLVENAVFLLVGPVASEKRQAVSLEEINAFENDVRYLGPRTDVPALLAISDLFVLPSYYREGVPRVLLEAANAGLPIITTDMPGCRDVVKSGWNGWIVPPRNVEELASAMIGALKTDKLTLRAMGERGRTRVEKEFGLEGVADAYADIYLLALEAGLSRREKVRGT
jgi:glycosyltransferase involved in cell wall biosynthesis